MNGYRASFGGAAGHRSARRQEGFHENRSQVGRYGPHELVRNSLSARCLTSVTGPADLNVRFHFGVARKSGTRNLSRRLARLGYARRRGAIYRRNAERRRNRGFGPGVTPSTPRPVRQECFRQVAAGYQRRRRKDGPSRILMFPRTAFALSCTRLWYRSRRSSHRARIHSGGYTTAMVKFPMIACKSEPYLMSL